MNELKELEAISRLLDPPQAQRDQWNAAVMNYAATYLQKVEQYKAFTQPGDDSGFEEAMEISEKATAFDQLLEHTSKHLDHKGLTQGSGGHLGYIPGGGLYPSALGDYMAALTNHYAGVFFASPGAVRLENMLIRWMCRLMGYPENAFGNLTSGGSIANLVAIVTARESHGIKARDIEHSVIYLSEQVHHSIDKAIRIAGLAEARIRYIPLDDGLRLSVDALEAAILEDQQEGLKPFFINTTLGTTNTGAIDPIAPIAKLASRHGLWLHVDACYGGFFRLVQDFEQPFRGIEQADSITLDPHKTLFLPFGTGAILIRNQTQLAQAFRYTADYMQDTLVADEEISPADVSPELTRHFRAMRMWLPLKLFGLKPFRAALKEKLLLARYLYQQLDDRDGFEVGPPPELSVVLFRYRPSGKSADDFNRTLVEAMQEDGRIFISSTTINGVFWLRAAIVVFRTHKEQIDLLLRLLDAQVPLVHSKL